MHIYTCKYRHIYIFTYPPDLIDHPKIFESRKNNEGKYLNHAEIFKAEIFKAEIFKSCKNIPNIEGLENFKSCQKFEGPAPPRCPSELILTCYKIFTPDHIYQAEMNQPTGLGNKPSTA